MKKEDKNKRVPELIQPDYQFDKKALESKQAKLSIILDKTTKDGTVKQLIHILRDFQVVKYKGVLYEVGSFLQIWDINLKEPCIGKLVRIVQVNKKIELLPFLQIEWCLKKKDLPPAILEQFGKHISNAQIFPSKLRYCLQVPSIKGKAQILPLQEYGQMTLSYENYYFTRAQYDCEKQELSPHPSTWRKQCYCGAPENPDLQYVLCEKCEQWFHVDCVSDKNLDVTYICRDCERASESQSIF